MPFSYFNPGGVPFPPRGTGALPSNIQSSVSTVYSMGWNFVPLWIPPQDKQEECLLKINELLAQPITFKGRKIDLADLAGQKFTDQELALLEPFIQSE